MRRPNPPHDVLLLRCAPPNNAAGTPGYAAAAWCDLGPVYSLNGVADAPGRVFLATGLSRVGGDEREAEGISDVIAVGLADLVARIGRREITDNESLAALLLALVALDRVSSS